ncbi:extracellular solute-binding protein [Paenibacillus doosanensis]|uniref:Lipoprotein LipO n=1 Tax=Paenibacillus konkukensis TaxID=2020716 RepID=A0ABY4RVX6_9BACL|nr:MULTISPECIES: extracellular solute-binding protein [Paenibacillus]MCS7460852.1 extracellular solute-binding protein [Paenibacillus doosanensis]UQZ86267.1 Lipoprotein LipO precursor [Paenibacillus konkukensis]
MRKNSHIVRAITGLGIVWLLAAASGCALSPPGQAQSGESGEAEPPAPEISMMLVLNQEEPPQDTILQQLQAMTKTKLSIAWVPDNIYTDKMAAAIAAGTLPKAMQVKAVDVKHPSVINGVRSGLFWEIGPYLKEYPLISRYMNPVIADNAAYYGKTYGIYWERPQSRQGIQYRKDWLDRLGLAPPRSIDDIYEVLKAFTHRDPDGNGRQDTYGLIDRGDLVYGAFKNIASYFGAPNNWGLTDGGLVPDFMTPEYAQAMKFMKKLYEEKLINPDFTVTSKTQQEERFAQGEAGMMISNVVASSMQYRIQKLNPEAVVDIANRIQGPKGERIWGGGGFGGLFLFPKASIKTEAELRGVLAFFNNLLAEDVNNLLTYGIEGRHYQLNGGRGTVKIFPDTQTLREREVEPYANALRTFDIRYLQLEETSEMQSKIQSMIQDNAEIAVQDPTAALFSETQAEKGAELQTIISDATYMYILGKIDEQGFAKEVEAWRRGGGDRIIAELNGEYAQLKQTKR